MRWGSGKDKSLLRVASGWRNQLQSVVTDNLSGAHGITESVAGVLSAFAHQEQDAGAEEVLEKLRIITRELILAQPAMASVIRLVNDVWLAIADATRDSPKHLLDNVSDVVEAHKGRSCHIVARIASEARVIMPERCTVVTISASSTVAECLAQAFQVGHLLQVVCLESRPVMEGRRMAERLSGAGVPVTVAVDALATHCVQTADLVLVGVDSATSTGVVSKVGAAGLVLAAARWEVPLYALADTSKVWPAALGEPVIRERSPDEVWADAPAGVSVLNRYFDVTEWSGVSGLITEDGILSGATVMDMGQSLNVSAELKAIYEGVRKAYG